jgi:hypothetical protein
MACIESYGAQRSLRYVRKQTGKARTAFTFAATHTNAYVICHHRRIILLLSAVALVLACLATCGCTFFLSGPADDSRSELEGYGLFKRAIYDNEDGSFLGCINYSQFWLDEINDKAFMVARICGIFSAALTTLAFICCVLVMLFTKHGKSCWWGIMRMSYFFALLSQVFTYSVWATKICQEFNGEETQCLAGANGVVGSFNVMVLLALTIFSCIVPAPCHPMFRLWYSRDPEKGPYDTDEMDEDLTRIAEEQSSDDTEFGMTTQTQPSEASKSVAQSRRSAKQSSVATSHRSEMQSVSEASSRRSEKESVDSKSRKSRSSGIISSRTIKSKQPTVAKSKMATNQSTDRPKHPEPHSRQSNGSSAHTNSTIRTDRESRRPKASKKESKVNSGLEDGDIIEIVEEFGPPSVGGSFDSDDFTPPLGTDDTEIIKVRTEYGPEGKKQIKEVIHADGSRTVTTLIDPMGLDEDVEIDALPDDA